MTATFPYPAGPGGTVPPEYRQHRATNPVAPVQLGDGTTIWLVTRYDDVVRVLTDPVFSRYQAAVLPGQGFGRSQGTGIVDLDPPAHDRLRRPIESALGPARVYRWKARIELIAHEAATGLANLPPTPDLVTAYAAPLAGRVTCELLGVRGEDWQAMTSDVELLLGAEHQPAELTAAATRIERGLTDVLATHRASPADDVTSTLLANESLTDRERITLLHGLLISGFIGVRDLLARHLFAVLADPTLTDRLRTDPELIPAAVEELLRCYPSSNDGLLRLATEEMNLGGTVLPAGAAVLPLVSAASRDPEHFDNPEQLNIDRAIAETVAFGAGRHACPAADLARVELRTGVAVLLQSYPQLTLAVPADEVEHRHNLLPVGIHRLPVVLGPLADSPFQSSMEGAS